MNLTGGNDSPDSPSPPDDIVLVPLGSLDLGGETNLVRFGRMGADILLACGLLAKGRRPEEVTDVVGEGGGWELLEVARPYMLERMESSKMEARGKRAWVVVLERFVREMSWERRVWRRGERGRERRRSV